jgi:hypothetical protein
MKNLLFWLFLALPAICQADCGSNHVIQLYPIDGVVSVNSIFILEDRGGNNVFYNLSTMYNPRLVSHNQTIRLIVTAIYQGTSGFSHAILKPERQPQFSGSYEFVIDKLPEKISISRRRNLQDSTQIRYTFSKPADKTIPVLSSVETVESKIDRPHFCTPENYVVFACPVIDQSQILVITHLTDKATNKKLSVATFTDGQKIRIGFYGCYGEVWFENAHQYEVSFEYMDICGNRCLGSQTILFNPAPHGS